MKILFCSLVSVKKKSSFLDPQQIPSGVYSQGGLLMGLGGGEGTRSAGSGQTHWEENSEAPPQPVSICYPSGVALQRIRLCSSLTFSRASLR